MRVSTVCLIVAVLCLLLAIEMTILMGINNGWWLVESMALVTAAYAGSCVVILRKNRL